MEMRRFDRTLMWKY